MRIVTRPDFDGVVCAVLLREAIDKALPILWAEPGDMQHGRVDVQDGDIVANLPFHDRCRMWFDHHYSNTPARPFEGVFEMAPSAAGLIHRYYADRLQRDHGELIRQTDKIDAADLSEDEVQGNSPAYAWATAGSDSPRAFSRPPRRCSARDKG